MWISSVISARRRWEGRMEEFGSESGDEEDVGKTALVEAEGLTSARMLRDDMGSSMGFWGDNCSCRGDFAALEVARDIKRTINGRMCFPSDVV